MTIIKKTVKDNIWEADLAEMRSLFSKNKNIRYLTFKILNL